jgi:hypothetical protein
MTTKNEHGDVNAEGTPTKPPLFGLGAPYATPAVLRHLAAHGRTALELLADHCTGEWGDLDEEDRQANARAVVEGSRILSAYAIGGVRVYVITEAEGDHGVRASTTLLLAEEY